MFELKYIYRNQIYMPDLHGIFVATNQKENVLLANNSLGYDKNSLEVHLEKLRPRQGKIYKNLRREYII